MNSAGPAEGGIGLQVTDGIVDALNQGLSGGRIVLSDELGFVIKIPQCLGKPANLHRFPRTYIHFLTKPSES